MLTYRGLGTSLLMFYTFLLQALFILNIISFQSFELSSISICHFPLLCIRTRSPPLTIYINTITHISLILTQGTDKEKVSTDKALIQDVPMGMRLLNSYRYGYKDRCHFHVFLYGFGFRFCFCFCSFTHTIAITLPYSTL